MKSVLNKLKTTQLLPWCIQYFSGCFSKRTENLRLITIKVFITDGAGDLPKLIDDYIDLTIKSISDGKIITEMLTVLPEDFHFKTGSSVEFLQEEILYHVPVGNYFIDRTVN